MTRTEGAKGEAQKRYGTQQHMRRTVPRLPSGSAQKARLCRCQPPAHQYMLVVTQAEVPRQASRGHDVLTTDPSTSISLRPGNSQLVCTLVKRGPTRCWGRTASDRSMC